MRCPPPCAAREAAAVPDTRLLRAELAFILHMPLAVSVHHAAGQSETVWPAGALDDPVVELRRANRSGDVRAFLLQVQICRAHRPVSQGLLDRPIPCQV